MFELQVFSIKFDIFHIKINKKFSTAQKKRKHQLNKRNSKKKRCSFHQNNILFNNFLH